MNDALSPPARSRLLDHDAGAWLVLALALLVTVFVWQASERQLERRVEERFIYEAEKEGKVILTRMQAYEQVLRGAAALFAASDHVSRDEWRAYVDQLELDKSLPGIQGIGFARAIPPGGREAHERAVRAEGFPYYTVSPSGEREPMSSIVYLEPFDQRNRRAFGYDMYSEPVRREAMLRARDSGQPALSGKVTLVQEIDADIQPGFLIYVPVYRNDMPQDDLASRRAALLGFAYSPFRAHDLMNGVLRPSGRDVELELFDGEARAENLLFASAEASRTARHTTDVELEIAGHVWTARVRSSRAFEESTAGVQPLLILAAGAGLDFSLLALLLINARHRRRMRAAAMALEQSRDSYRTLVENVPGTVFRSQAEAPWLAQHVSSGIEALVGAPPQEFLRGEITHRQFTHPDDMQMVVDAVARAVAEHGTYNVEYRMRSRDNRIRWVSERGRATYGPGGVAQWLDGVILDVTDRKVAELAIRDLAFYDPLTGLPNRRLLIDRLAQELATTDRSGRYDALLFVDMDNFKAVNDGLGHDAGDLLLVEVAHRLRGNVRESDTVARLGGDEFVVILDDLADDDIQAAAIARQIGEKIIAALNEPFRLGRHLHRSTPSIGITTFSGHRATVDELLRRADQAMYRAKSAGRNRLKFHEPDRVS